MPMMMLCSVKRNNTTVNRRSVKWRNFLFVRGPHTGFVWYRVYRSDFVANLRNSRTRDSRSPLGFLFTAGNCASDETLKGTTQQQGCVYSSNVGQYELSQQPIRQSSVYRYRARLFGDQSGIPREFKGLPLSFVFYYFRRLFTNATELRGPLIASLVKELTHEGIDPSMDNMLGGFLQCNAP